jgi:energy-coupling factor transport system permease protein
MIISWRYRKRTSLMEGFDTRARWIFSMTFLFSVTLYWDWRFLLGFFILSAAWYASARIEWADIRRAWFLILFIVTVTIVVNTLITGGGAGGVVPEGGHLVWPGGIPLPFTSWTIPFGLTYERVWFAFCQVLRLIGISMIFVIIPYSMDPRLYGVTFRGLGFPDRFAYAMELAFRYVPTLARDFSVTLDAQKARGYELERADGGLFRQLARLAPLIVPVTMGSILTGEDVTNAMDLRCFGIGPRTWLYELRYRRRDYALIAFGTGLLLASIILSFGFGVGGFTVPPWFLP